MAITPWMTSDQIVDSVKRKISFPTSQDTFTNSDILAFANEEMFISQVPSVLEYHQDYFAYSIKIPLQTNTARYPIPSRATGMKLRDMFFVDQNGNIFEMTRIPSDDRAFFQVNTGVNQAAFSFYIEGNDVVLTPGVAPSPSGSLLMVFYLRPNQLVKNDRAATITSFSQTVLINNSLVNQGDTLVVGNLSDFPNLITTTYTAVNTLGGTISSILLNGTATTTINTSAPHLLTNGQLVTITGSDSVPSVDGTYPASVISSTQFTIPIGIGVAGTTGSYTSPNQFLIGGNASMTAANLSTAVNNTNVFYPPLQTMGATSNLGVVTFTFPNIYTGFQSSNLIGIVPTTQTITINFDVLPSSYFDPETNQTSPLFVNGALIDFMQQRPGHKIYLYDINIPKNGISGTSITLPQQSLLVVSGNTGTGLQETLAALVPGDYICLANEAIIPQIPPDLHNALAERTSMRILAAIGDVQGVQVSNAKIQEIEQRQGNLLDNRIEGAPLKIAARHSLLRYGKFWLRWRF